MEIKVRTKEQQAIDNLKAIVNSKDKIIEIEPPIEDTAQILLDYITNLQEENKEWNMIFDGLSKRPYAHKYLEEKRKELNNDKIVGLDSEMIYKDYYKLKERCEYLQRSCERKEEQRDTARMEYMEQEDYKSRNEKAIEYIKNKQELNKMFGTITLSKDSQNELLSILGGDE